MNKALAIIDSHPPATARNRAGFYASAAELAEFAEWRGLLCFPHTKRGAARFIKRHGWNDVGDLCRRRSGVTGGGGTEYHISLWPETLQAAFFAEYEKRRRANELDTNQALDERRKRELSTTDLTAHQRAVMDARAAVLNTIEAHRIEQKQSRRQAILAFVAVLDEHHPLADIAAVANDRSNCKYTVSLRAVQLWFKLYGEGGVAALAPKKTRKKDPLPVWFDDFLKFFARPQKPAVAHALRMYAKSLPDPARAPDYDQVQRALKKLDDSFGTIARHRGREGRLTLKARMAYTIRSTEGVLPTSIYTADGQTFDAEIAHPIHGQAFRPEITSILDVATRKNVGWSVGLSENTIVIIDALRMASMGNGIAAIFYVDRGPGYKNDAVDNELTGFCARLGMTKLHALPQNSQGKGVIERYNGTVLVPLAKEFATYIGADMDREAGQKVHRLTRRELKQFGTSRTLPAWQDFLAAMNEAVDNYNNCPHSALNGATPNEAWQGHVADGFQPVEVTQAEADDLFRPCFKRRTRRALVEWNKNKYFHIDLEAHHGKHVLVGIDIHDASRVWVRAIEPTDDGERPGKLICVAEFAGNETRYVPQTMENEAIEKRHKQRKRRLELHMDEVNGELAPSRLLEASAMPEMPLIKPAGPVLVVNNEPACDAPQAKPADPDAIPVFKDDLSLARWAIEHPEKLLPNHVLVLRDCLSTPAMRDHFEAAGVDLTCLRDVIRSTSNQTAR